MKEILCIALILLMSFSLLFYTALKFESLVCDRKAASFVDYKHYVLGGCMVKHDGLWVPIENVRFLDNKESEQ